MKRDITWTACCIIKETAAAREDPWKLDFYNTTLSMAEQLIKSPKVSGELIALGPFPQPPPPLC